MISLIILGIIFLYAIISYNTLTRKRNNVDNAFGSIDVMLKKRFDLIPNLVATVQQYAKHEEETFAKITNLRTKSYDSLTAEEKTDFDKAFTAAKNNFFMVAENYPALRSSENFMQLQKTLNETEEQLSASRRTYNAAVTDYNNSDDLSIQHHCQSVQFYQKRSIRYSGGGKSESGCKKIVPILIHSYGTKLSGYL